MFRLQLQVSPCEGGTGAPSPSVALTEAALCSKKALGWYLKYCASDWLTDQVFHVSSEAR